jgi:hypothetical protein
VNEWKRPISGSVQRRLVGLDVVPPATGLRRSRQRSLAPPCANSMIVFCGDAQQVSDGFALALNAMESHAHLLMMGTEPVPERDRVRASERSAKRRK